MTRLFAAALLLCASAAPALACDWMNKSAATDSQTKTLAAQPTGSSVPTAPAQAPAAAPGTAQPNVYVPS